MEVTLSEMKSLYRMGDESTKDFIAGRWPEVIRKPSAQEALDMFMSKNPKFKNGFNSEIYVVEFKEEEYIILELPNANKAWTLEVFEIIKQFLIDYPHSFPVHFVDDYLKPSVKRNKPFMAIKYYHF